MTQVTVGCRQWVPLAALPGGRRQALAQALASFYSTPPFQEHLKMHTSTAVQGLRWGWALPAVSGARGCIPGVPAGP